VGLLEASAKDLELCQIEQKGHYNRPEALWRQDGLSKGAAEAPKASKINLNSSTWTNFPPVESICTHRCHLYTRTRVA
jgi:hypothetical protein